MLFDVIYHPDVESELITFWLNSPVRNNFSHALNRIDQMLSSNPRKFGYEVAEDLYAIVDSPVKLFFEIHENSFTVHVTGIAALR